MKYDEFVEYANAYVEALTEVFELAHPEEGIGLRLNGSTKSKIQELQMKAAEAFGQIDHVFDIYGERRTQFGEGNREVDKFKESLAVYDMVGSAIIEDAIAEVRIVMAKLSRLHSMNPRLKLPEPPEPMELLEAKGVGAETNALQMMERRFGSSVEQGLKELLALFPFEKNVFVMMPFAGPSSRACAKKLWEIYHIIEKTLQRCYGLTTLRADFRDFSRSGWLWDNVCVYMLGSRYGIAVLENFYKDEFNPNVAIEFGFMKCLGREVLILKDKNFEHVRADLLGRLWSEFDSSSEEGMGKNIEEAIHRWLIGKVTRIL